MPEPSSSDQSGQQRPAPAGRSHRDRLGRVTPRAYRILAAVLKTMLRAISKPDWRGVEHLHRREGYIAAANHVTMLDPVTTAHMLYDNGAAPKIMAKAELFKLPVLGPVLRATGQIPVHRNSRSAADSLTDARAALTAGEVVLIFPEGTLTTDADLWPMAIRTGVARLALTSGVPVVPIASLGPERILPQRGYFPRIFPRQRIHALAGPPVDLSDLQGRVDATALAEATARIRAAITVQLAQLRGEDPPAWAAATTGGDA